MGREQERKKCWWISYLRKKTSPSLWIPSCKSASLSDVIISDEKIAVCRYCHKEIHPNSKNLSQNDKKVNACIEISESSKELQEREGSSKKAQNHCWPISQRI
jgi:hypothetical protein